MYFQDFNVNMIIHLIVYLLYHARYIKKKINVARSVKLRNVSYNSASGNNAHRRIHERSTLLNLVISLYITKREKRKKQ